MFHFFLILSVFIFIRFFSTCSYSRFRSRFQAVSKLRLEQKKRDSAASFVLKRRRADEKATIALCVDFSWQRSRAKGEDVISH